MKYLYKTIKLSGVFLVLIGISCQKDFQLRPSSTQDELDNAIDHGIDGIIIAVNQDNETKLYSAGWNNRENKVPSNPNSLFKIASISKLYIATAAVQLIASNQLDLNDRLSVMIPETNGKIENADKITLKMLLQHRSGIPEYIYNPAFKVDTEESYMSTISLIYGESSLFKPNKKYSYSNTNYLIIAEIIERAIGYSHHDYIDENILNPLNLKNTYHLYSQVDTNKVMSGYLKGYDHDLKSIEHTRPGGSMIATASDVSSFLRALIDGTLLSNEEQKLYSQVYKYEHTGWIHGYTSIARYNSDIDAVIVQFTSTSDNELFWLKLENIYDRIVKTLY